MSTLQSVSSITTTVSSARSARRVLNACCVMSLGAVLLYFAGFSSLPALHNAAHETRHTAAFPCH